MTAAAPDANNKVWTKAAIKDLGRQAERFLKQLLFLDELFFHGGCRPEDIGVAKTALYSVLQENPKL